MHRVRSRPCSAFRSEDGNSNGGARIDGTRGRSQRDVRKRDGARWPTQRCDFGEAPPQRASAQIRFERAAEEGACAVGGSSERTARGGQRSGKPARPHPVAMSPKPSSIEAGRRGPARRAAPRGSAEDPRSRISVPYPCAACGCPQSGLRHPHPSTRAGAPRVSLSTGGLAPMRLAFPGADVQTCVPGSISASASSHDAWHTSSSVHRSPRAVRKTPARSEKLSPKEATGSQSGFIRPHPAPVGPYTDTHEQSRLTAVSLPDVGAVRDGGRLVPTASALFGTGASVSVDGRDLKPYSDDDPALTGTKLHVCHARRLRRGRDAMPGPALSLERRAHVILPGYAPSGR